MFSRIGQYIRSHRRNALLRLAAQTAEKYLRAYYNEAFYDFARNGEHFVIEAFSRWIGDHPVNVWDVGANHGQWAREAHATMPNATIVSFEIIPALADKIRREAQQCHWWQVVQCGLSDRQGTIEVTWNHRNDDTSAVAPAADNPFFAHSELERISCPVTTLDQYWQETGLAPALLKIDVEGHEAAVLAGGSTLLAGAVAPAMIQFEYGTTWVGAERMLGPVQRQLEAFGYVVGRLFPNHVDFRSFASADEHYRMGNMIAVRDKSLLAMLAGQTHG